jgi:membrane protein
MGLAYKTLVSLVPLLAVTFSVLKAFGVQKAMEPALLKALSPLAPEGVEVSRRVIGFVNNVRVGALGAVGVAALFYTVITLLGEVEEAFNRIWRVRRGRPLGRKFTEYLSVVMVGPVLVFAAFALTASAESSWLAQRIVEFKPLGLLVVVATRLAPFVLLWAAFSFMYGFVPYTRVRPASALVGGAVGAVLWQIAGTAFAAFVAGSAGYTAVYASFAVLVLFLVWLYVAWLIVLLGAEVTYLHQHRHALRGVERADPWGENARERLALRALAEVTRGYLRGEGPRKPQELARTLAVALPDLEALLDRFVQQGLLCRTAEPEGVALGRPPEQVSVIEVLEGLRGREDPRAADAAADKPVAEVLGQRDVAVRATLGKVTLLALALGASSEPTAGAGS